MTENRLKKVYIAGGVLLYIAFLLFYVNDSYPWVGHDYRYFLPRLLDTYIHYLNNGFTIQWFTPSFGGGLPAYPHPQHLQFSLNQLLMFLVNPWIANLLTISIFTLVGFISFYRLLLDEFELGWMASGLGALFFCCNGMLIQHSTTGTGYEGFPLIALVIFVLLSRRVSTGLASVVIGLVLALWLNSAGFYLFIILGLTSMIGLPLQAILSPPRFQLRSITKKILLGGGIFSLLSAGKLYAVFSYLQHFPRVVIDNYYSNFAESVVGLVMQLIGVPIFTLPLRILGKDPAAVGKMMTALIGGSEFGIWEMDVSISPVLVFLLFFRIRKSLGRMIKKGRLHRPVLNLKKEQVYAWVVLIFGLWLTFEFTSARGVLYPLFRDFPVLRSLHNNIRYAGSFILPLAILGAYFFDDEINQIEPPNRFKVYSFFLWGTLIWLGVYFFLPNDLQSRNFNIEQTLSDYQRAKAGEKFYISEVKNIFDHQVISNHATSLFPYDPLFGYNLEDFSTKLQPGSIYQVEDGFFNLTNPRSLVYDSDETFARFTTDQREMMEQFAHYQQPDWDIPRIQHILNAISGTTMLIILGCGLFLFLKRFL